MEIDIMTAVTESAGTRQRVTFSLDTELGMPVDDFPFNTIAFSTTLGATHDEWSPLTPARMDFL
jgi:hypothetical protein